MVLFQNLNITDKKEDEDKSSDPATMRTSGTIISTSKDESFGKQSSPRGKHHHQDGNFNKLKILMQTNLSKGEDGAEMKTGYRLPRSKSQMKTEQPSPFRPV